MSDIEAIVPPPAASNDDAKPVTSESNNDAKPVTSESKDDAKPVTSESKAAPATENGASSGSRTDQNDRFELKVKSDFILEERSPVLAPIPEVEAPAEGDRGGKKKKKGMNKKRPRDVRQDASEKVCLAVIRGAKCPYEGTCKYSHDLSEFMKTRPEDIKELGECPNYQVQGFCMYGAMCRFGSCHINKAGENMHKDGTNIPVEKPAQPLPETAANLLPRDVQIQLRKRNYPFQCKRHFEDEEKKSNGDDKGKDAVTAAPSGSSSSSTPVELKTRKIIDFSNKIYVAPLTTVGNLPFRRIMKKYGADITCGEMALATCLLEGKPSEWALLKRHPDEDVFGVQIAAAHPDQFTRACELIENYTSVDFVDLNLGCPLDLVCNKGAGAALMMRDRKLKGALEGISRTLSCPFTIKMRTGWDMSKPFAHQLVPKIQSWGIDGISAVMIHGRSRLQRYQKLANWDYISEVAQSQSSDLAKIPLIGNGDIFSYTDYEEKIASHESVSKTAMLARGALIKPWLPTEIKERRHWDISASERLDILKEFVRFGLEHWGSDQQGVNNTRRFLLEWLSFLYRYVPVGLLETAPQAMNQRPPKNMCGRNDLETLFLSDQSADWVKISEMLLGPVPGEFMFEPKHKANGYA